MDTEAAGPEGPATVLTPDAERTALNIARQLVAAGVPLFVAQPDPSSSCGFRLPPRWETSVPTPNVVDRWRSGWALAAVCGHALDVLDVDPRNGGDVSAEGLRAAGMWPRVYGTAATPSGGTHDLIAPLHVGKGVPAPGIDLQGGRPDGTGRGFVFIAPTVRRSKVDGVLRPYVWLTVPDLAGLADGTDDTGQAMADLVRAKSNGHKPTAGQDGAGAPAPTPEVLARIAQLAAELGNAPDGKGNDTAARVAFWCGQYVGAGQVDAGTAERILLAGTDGWTWRGGQQARAALTYTVRRQLAAGAADPRAWKAPRQPTAEAHDATTFGQSGGTGSAPAGEATAKGASAFSGPPKPIDTIDGTPLPPSSKGHLSDLWTFVDAVAESLQVPREMVFLLVLSILSTASRGHWRARVSADWVEPLAIMTATVMPSGSRKTATVDRVARPIYETEREWRNKKAPEIASASAEREVRQGEYERLRKRLGSATPPDMAEVVAARVAVEDVVVPPVPRLVADDVTVEKLAMLMAEQGGPMAVISAEGTLFAILAGRYSAGTPNLEFVLKAHAGERASVDRVSREPLLIEAPFLAIGQTVQPDVLEGLAETRQFRGTGLLARYLFALPASMVGRRKIDPDPVPEAVSEAWSRRVKAILSASEEACDPVVLNLSDRARQRLRNFREQLEPKLAEIGGQFGEIADWASKLPGALVRIAALFALFADPEARTVDDWAMAAALDLEGFLSAEAIKAFDAINGRHARIARHRAVVAWIKRKKINTFTVRELRRALGGQQWATDVETLRDVLVDLEEMGWVWSPDEAAAKGKPGRPASERFVVNPAVHVGAPPAGFVNSVNTDGGTGSDAPSPDQGFVNSVNTDGGTGSDAPSSPPDQEEETWVA